VAAVRDVAAQRYAVAVRDVAGRRCAAAAVRNEAARRYAVAVRDAAGRRCAVVAVSGVLRDEERVLRAAAGLVSSVPVKTRLSSARAKQQSEVMRRREP
jgi:hypothetical protein